MISGGFPLIGIGRPDRSANQRPVLFGEKKA